MSKADPFAPLELGVPMREYHDGRFVTASFVDRVRAEGLSVALHERKQPRGVEVRPSVLIGTAVHEMIQGFIPWASDGGPLLVARDAEHRKAWLAEAAFVSAEGIILEVDSQVAKKAFSSVAGLDSIAKCQALALMASREQVAEATYSWQPVDGLECAVRPDMMVCIDGQMIAVPIKTTALPITLSSWWRQWSGGPRTHGWLTSACFHWYGLERAFGRPIPQIWLTIRTVKPYPWALTQVSGNEGSEYLWRGQSALKTMEEHWEKEIIPTLEVIRDAGLSGIEHGPEEGGIVDVSRN